MLTPSAGAAVEVLRYSNFRSERHKWWPLFFWVISFVILSVAKDLDGRSGARVVQRV